MSEVYSGVNEHQTVLMELWRVFDEICKKHHIHYMLFAGSALGAIRHKGIIPWDDDLDVVLMREDYEKFLRVAPFELDEGKYFLQPEFSEHFPMFFSKLRKNGTACMERYVPKDPMMHQGIYIDIFPCDNLSDSPIMQRLQFLISKAVIAKSLNQRGYLTDSKIKRLFILLSKPLPKLPLARYAQRKKDNCTGFVHTFFGGARDFEKNIYPRVWFEEIIWVPFGDFQAPVSKYYHKLLTKLYGDYMTPLSVEKRNCKVHADIVDAHRSYEFYLEAQKNQTVNEFTRSIR